MSEVMQRLLAERRERIANERLAVERLRAERRERIATACLASLLSHDGWERISAPYLTQHAVGYADELINELDREAKP
ncbi:MAG: hypothetical protein RL006_1085 [Chloroflexota bacterium]|jgi:hypothetical protein